MQADDTVRFTPDDTAIICNPLLKQKAIGPDLISMEHIKYAPPSFHSLLAQLFDAILSDLSILP